MAQTLGAIKVRLNNQTESKVRSISYGQPLELKRALDLSMYGAEDGEVIVYNGITNSFEVAPVPAGEVVAIYGGIF